MKRSRFSRLKSHDELPVIGALIILLILTFFISKPQAPAAPQSPTYYANALFDASRIHKIEVNLPLESLADLRTYPTNKTKYSATVSIDGLELSHVSFATHGNASLYGLAEDETSDRYSYKLKFNKYIRGQTYLGLDELVLDNLNSDPSGMHNFLAYEIMRATDVEAPLTSYTELYINGQLQGLYLATEELDQSFLKRYNEPKNAALYKPEALANDNDRISARRQSLAQTGEPEPFLIISDAKNPDFDFEGVDLVYRGDDPSLYVGIFENEVTKNTPADRERLIEAIKSLSPGSELAPEDYWDVDALIRYFVAHNFVLNSDSYTGYTAHNYLIKTSRGHSTLLPWDYNLAFQTLWLDEDDSLPEGDPLEYDIDTPLLGPEPESRPLWQLIATNPDYLEQYHIAFRQLLNDYLLSGDCLETISETYSLIRPYVEADPTKFYTLDEFDAGVEYLHRFVYHRTKSIEDQLDDTPQLELRSRVY